ncbi:aminoglycoside phosphotransferase family protein [Halomonas sp. M20]|uniref:aminoglycoside phosphotransferase family protein n=1 Tax=Halomonas sp. M20 TaxID=2763264 RepID=UPI001D0A490A|nr:phosphotransferase [Halomonas sp. M20]
MSNAGETARLDALREWVTARHHLPSDARLELAAGDASFRRYFRLWLESGRTRILMDAPPEKENSQPFVTIAEAWRGAGLPVPVVHATHLTAGFIELEDLGDTPLHLSLGECESPESLAWHERALMLIGTLQNRAPFDALPVYDSSLFARELDLFPEWCLDKLLGIAPPACWQHLHQRLITLALGQPMAAVHRDFDAMNLMLRDDELWLIDFQDAVHGPITYDPVSLLRGRYCRFPRERYAAWLEEFRCQAIADGRLRASVDSASFLHLADTMAAQRSLKVLGIFCRLTLRDDKSGYLARLPHFLNHLYDSLLPWPEFDEFVEWLDDIFAPALTQELARRGIPGAAS